mgnify:CR=1 FL=1
MYAVFQSGGKQHRVTEGQKIRLQKLDVETGASVEFDKGLLGLGKALVQSERFLAGHRQEIKLNDDSHL